MPDQEVQYALRILARNGISEARSLLEAQEILEKVRAFLCIHSTSYVERCSNCWHSIYLNDLESMKEKQKIQKNILSYQVDKFLLSLKEEEK